ncbi:hypothetical protein [Polaribacter glomeratus]|uniref:Uncharacterized protein n=1 Tax=Polaribacter glomeratus TaxID=102 RepID=A0A2S7WGX9_9FLAO|nr:hypothetical protein [Polaribacter glomeratus]PQJ76873.1 hypothetical protein BTO16_13460 [Polaribacter glomeratus]TXD67285.1 hypothetical protein ESX12_01455 [Polaribacter glomeratus]
MELSTEQIQELYIFTRKHYVEYYDVQTELVDHLANDIEQISEENPNLSFEQARDTSFKKFGVFGFMDIVESRQKQLGKKYNKILWSIMKEWFTIPKIMITASIFMFFYLLMSLNINIHYLSVLMLILAFIDIFLASKLSKKSKKRFKDNNKKYLLEDIIFKVSAFSSVIIFSNIFNLSAFLRYSESLYTKVFVASLITLAILYSYISLIVIPQKAEELLQETYPEYKFINNL